MANYFVDSTTGDNGDNGTTMDLAWATVEYALESGGLSAGDIVWVRRIHSETPGSDISVLYDGAAGAPIQTIGWPRAALPNTTITEGDWANGSELVDNVVGITPDREKHIARHCTAPDGKVYFITAVLWEFTVDGMAGGAEFAVGEILTNTTQTKKGKVWAFTDNLDTTGTVQAVVDSSTAWVENDNITSDGGGDAELSANATAVGFLIDREYPGGTVAGVDGKFQIEADDDWYADMGTQYGFDDSGWTIKETTWDADADDMPVIDFNDGAFSLAFNQDQYHVLKNMEFKDSADTVGIINLINDLGLSIIGCLMKQTASNTPLVSIISAKFYSERAVMEGGGAGSAQTGFNNTSGCGLVTLKDCAIYNMGDSGILLGSGLLILDNVSLGVEMANGDSEFNHYRHGPTVRGQDVRLGGTNGYVTRNISSSPKISIGNFQKVLGDHATYFPGGAVGSTGGFANVDVGDTNAPSAASPAGTTTDLICVYPNVTGYEFIEDWAIRICRWKVWAAAAAETYTVYLQNNMGVTLNDTAAKDDIWLRMTYIDTFDDATEYNKTKLFSTEIDILQRANDTDWDSLTIANHTPAVAGWVTLELFVSKYVAAGQIYIDPEWV